MFIFSGEPQPTGVDTTGRTLLGLAILFLGVGFSLCCYACKKVERESNKRSHQGVVYSVRNLFIDL